MNHAVDHLAEPPITNHTMMMYFHGGFDEVILFDFWRVSSLTGLLGSMLTCLAAAVAYEGLKFVRETVLRRHLQAEQGRYGTMSEEPVASGSTAGETDQASEIRPASTASTARTVRSLDSKMLSKTHLLLTALHFLQMTLAYLLMLVVMTFNSWLCLAVVAGATAGHFFFGWRRTLLLEEEEHCH